MTNDSKELSLTYRVLRGMGFNYSEEEYGDVSIMKVIGQFFRNTYHALLLSMMNWWILEPFEPRMLRPFLLRRLGAKVGKGVFVGDHVWFDMNHANLITIDDDAHITGGCRLLCHQRDLKSYHHGDNAAKLPYKYGEIQIGKGVMIGMMTMVMPETVIGEGVIIGAHSLVVGEIPPFTIAVGSPAKVIKEIE